MPTSGTLVVETLTGHDDRLAQAEALARDYAAEQQAYHHGQRLENPLPKPGDVDGEERSWAA